MTNVDINQLKKIKQNAKPELYYSKTEHIYLTSC